MFKKIISHPLIKGSTIIFIGSFFASLCNYLFNLILGRFFAPADYGTYAALITFLGLFGIFPSTFTQIFAKFAAVYKAKDETQNINILFASGLRIVSIFAGIIFLFLSVSVFYTSSFLHIQDVRLLFLIFFTIFLSIVASVPAGILQGEMRLSILSLVIISSPFLKIFIGLLMLFLGLKILGVTIAIFLSSLMTLIFLFFLFRNSYKKEKRITINQPPFLKEFKSYSIRFFFSALGIVILTSADIMFVKHFFNPEQAGQYAALSLMGKSIFYLTSPIYFVFFPLIAQKKEKKENMYNTLLLAIGIITLCSVGLSFVYFLFPTTILNIFFPASEYKVLASYLGPFSLYIIIFSIAMLFNNFLLSIGKSGIYKINLLVSALFIVLMYVFHSSFYQIIAVLFSTSLLLLALHLLYYVLTTHDKK